MSQDLMLHLQPPELRAFSSNHAPRFIGPISEKFPPIQGGGVVVSWASSARFSIFALFTRIILPWYFFGAADIVLGLLVNSS